MSILRLNPSRYLDPIPEVFKLEPENTTSTLVLNPKHPDFQPTISSNFPTTLSPGLTNGIVRHENGYIDLDSTEVWDRIFKENPNIWDFVLVPGDYRHWGVCQLTRASVPTENTLIDGKHRRRTIQILPTTPTLRGSTQSCWYTGEAVQHDISNCTIIPDLPHPVQRPFYQAKIGPLLIRNRNRDEGDVERNWVIHGLTSTTKTMDKQSSRQNGGGWSLGNADNIVIDMCLIEERTGNYGIRIFGHNNTVQRCVIRNLDKTKGDTVGVGITPFFHERTGKAFESSGNKILDNEIYNMSDCIAANSNNQDKNINVGGTIIDGNDLYHEPNYHDFSDNLIDIKTGSDLPKGQCIVTNNRIWSHGLGQQPAAGKANANDEMILLHESARNWMFKNNIIGEGIKTIGEKNWGTIDPPNFSASPDQDARFAGRKIRFLENVVYDCWWAISAFTNMRVEKNDFINISCLFGRVGPKGSEADRSGRAGANLPEPEIKNNRFLNVHRIKYALSDRPNSIDGKNSFEEIYMPPYDGTKDHGFPPSWFIYERKRWTGPEFKLVRTRNHSELPGDGVLHEPIATKRLSSARPEIQSEDDGSIIQ